MIAPKNLHHFLSSLPKLYSPRSIVDFPAHAIAVIAQLMSDRSTSIVSSPQPPQLAFFSRYFQLHHGSITKISQLLNESDGQRVEAVYWRFGDLTNITNKTRQIFTDPDYLTTTHAIYQLEADALCLSVTRNNEQTTQSDRYLLDLIHPHLIQAYQNALAFSQQYQDRSVAVRHSQEGFNLACSFSIDSLQLLGLTKREAEVLYWIAKDKTNGEIANLFECSLSAVKKHVEHIYEKLEVQTRTAAVMNALVQLGSIDDRSD
jgi:DNA-binding CsgD family transcriptional regulator